MELDDALTTTRTVRKRLDLDRPVERSVVEECLELALQAPNGSNQQRWRWVLVDDPQIRAEAAAIYRRGLDGYVGTSTVEYDVADDDLVRISESVMYLRENLHRVPVLVVPLIDGQVERADLFLQASLWGSVLPAVWSFLLALRSRGLGSAWTTIHLHRQREMAELLGIPDTFTQVGLFPVAYTLGRAFRPAKRRALHDVAAWNTFDHLGDA
jgi:nitroreductase